MEAVSEPPEWVQPKRLDKSTSTLGRRVWRLEGHVSIPMGLPPAKAAKALIHKRAPFKAPAHYPSVAEMTVTEKGILVEMEDGTEILVHDALCYHSILEPLA